MTIMQLNYFCTACECGNITKAAKVMFVTQPAITSAIKQLEQEFGLTLLDRNARGGVKLTSEGREFYESGKILLRSIHDFEKRMLQMGQQNKYVNLGLTRSVGSSTYVEYFSYGNQVHHDLHLATRIGSSGELLVLLREGQLDAVIIPSQEKDDLKDLEKEVLKNTAMVCCMSKDNPLAKEPVLTAEMIAREPMISTKGDNNKLAALSRFFKDNGLDVRPNIIERYDQLSTALGMIRRNAGIGYFPEDGVKNTEGIVCRIIDKDPPISIYVVWSKEAYKKESVRVFLRSLRRFYKESDMYPESWTH